VTTRRLPALSSVVQETRQGPDLLLVEVVRLVEAKQEQPPAAAGDAREADQHLLDVLVVKQGDRAVGGVLRAQADLPGLLRVQVIPGQPARGQAGDLLVPFHGQGIGGAEETQQDRLNRPLRRGAPRREAVDPAVVGRLDLRPPGPLDVLPAERLFDGGIDKPEQRRPPQGRGLAAGEHVEHALDEVARQTFGAGLEVVEVDETGPVGGPAGQSRQQMALADAGLAPDDHADAPVLGVGLAPQVEDLLKLRLVDVGHIDQVRREHAIHAVGQERVGRTQMATKIIQRGGHEAFLETKSKRDPSSWMPESRSSGEIPCRPSAALRR